VSGLNEAPAGVRGHLLATRGAVPRGVTSHPVRASVREKDKTRHLQILLSFREVAGQPFHRIGTRRDKSRGLNQILPRQNRMSFTLATQCRFRPYRELAQHAPLLAAGGNADPYAGCDASPRTLLSTRARVNGHLQFKSQASAHN